MSNDSDKRAKALNRIKDEQMLKHVCKFSRYDDSRIAAAHKLAALVEKIEDPEALRLVLAYAKESKNRPLAEKRIEELGKPAPKPSITKIEAMPKMVAITKDDTITKIEARPMEAKDQLRAELKNEPQSSKTETHASIHSNHGGFWGMLKELIGV
jgi:hypothetical protein